MSTKLGINSKFGSFVINTTVFVLMFCFGYLMHSLTAVVVHDNQIDALRTEIGVQDAELAKCPGHTPAATGR